MPYPDPDQQKRATGAFRTKARGEGRRRGKPVWRGRAPTTADAKRGDGRGKHGHITAEPEILRRARRRAAGGYNNLID